MILSPGIESLIAETEKVPLDCDLSQEVARSIVFSPCIVLELLPYFFEKNFKYSQHEAILRLILCCFDQIRCELDRKSPAAKALFDEIEGILQDLYLEHSEDIAKVSEINTLIYQGKLDFVIDLEKIDGQSSSVQYDFTDARFIEILEQIRLDSSIRSAFDFYEWLMSQIQVIPIRHLLGLVEQLAITKKVMTHEVAVMMALAPKPESRAAILKTLLSLSDKKLFTPLDLRRLMVMRDWLPIAEQYPMDELIHTVQAQGVRPYPHPVSKIDKIVASAFDGAGAQIIMFKLKHQGRHMVAGFVLKQGVGIREPWVESKVQRDQFDTICEQSEIYLKPVTMAYVNRAVRHFLAEGRESGNVPSPLLLELVEIIGATEWKAARISVQDEIDRLSQKMDFSLKNKNEVKRALVRAESWYFTQPFMQTWFECGELSERALQSAGKGQRRLFMKGDTVGMRKKFIEKLVVPNMEKWTILMLFMCLWAISKEVEMPLWQDMLVSLDQALSGDTPLEDIPIIECIAGQTVAAIANRKGILLED